MTRFLVVHGAMLGETRTVCERASVVSLRIALVGWITQCTSLHCCWCKVVSNDRTYLPLASLYVLHSSKDIVTTLRSSCDTWRVSYSTLFLSREETLKWNFA